MSITTGYPSGELHTLESLAITSISLADTNSPKTDQYGNHFKLKGKLTGAEGDKVDRVIYDVTLVTAKSKNSTTASAALPAR
jgi:hypothetical protein